MLEQLIRDRDLVPSVGRRFGRFYERIAAGRELLMAGRGLRGARRKKANALIDLALRFETWRTLCRQGELDDAAAVDLFAGLVAAI